MRPPTGPALRAGDHFHGLSGDFLARSQHHHAESNSGIGNQPKPNVVRFQRIGGIQWRRLFQSNEDFGRGNRQAFSGANIKRYALPAPGISFCKLGLP
jgi:hypothetical protein